MKIEFIKYNPDEIIPDGRYWIVTEKIHQGIFNIPLVKHNYMSAMITRSSDSDRMSVDISNQRCIMRSKYKILEI